MSDTIDWHLGGRRGHSGPKRLHTPDCRYAVTRYTWAQGKTPDELLAALKRSGGIEWHDACRACLPDLALRIIRTRAADDWWYTMFVGALK